jgi:hypothetical protein
LGTTWKWVSSMRKDFDRSLHRPPQTLQRMKIVADRDKNHKVDTSDSERSAGVVAWQEGDC